MKFNQEPLYNNQIQSLQKSLNYGSILSKQNKNFKQSPYSHFNPIPKPYVLPTARMSLGNLALLGAIQAGAWSYETDFTSDDASDSGANIIIDTSLTQITWEILRNGSNHSLSIDLIGAVISDTAWLLRLPIETTVLDPAPTKSMEGHFGISDFNNTRDATQTEDYMGLMLGTALGGNETYEAETKVAQTLNDGAGKTLFAHVLVLEAIFSQIKRLTATTGSYGLSDGNDYNDDIEVETPTIDSATNLLRYFVVRNIKATGGSAGDLAGKCDANLQFNDGVSTPP